jgi:hypothetical protein
MFCVPAFLSVRNASRASQSLLGSFPQHSLSFKSCLYCSVLFLYSLPPSVWSSFGFLFLCVPLSGWLLWSSPILCFVELGTGAAVFPLSSVLCQKLGRLVNVQD